MKWWVDKTGTRRYPAKEHKRRIDAIQNLGIPCVVYYDVRDVRGDPWVVINVAPQPGFVHLSHPDDVKWCTENKGQYHMYLARMRYFPRDPLSDMNMVMQQIKARFSYPRVVRLKVSWINETSCVARLAADDPTFAAWNRKMGLIRRVWGNHDTPDLTISL